VYEALSYQLYSEDEMPEAYVPLSPHTTSYLRLKGS
jgi:hypothetical protein